MKNIMNDLKS